MSEIKFQPFYQPENGICGDFIPFYWQGVYYLFFLQGMELLEVSLITTVDFLHITEYGIVIPKGGDDSQDRSIGTGCVYELDGVFYFIYTGFNPHLRGQQGQFEQVLMRATSTDLLHWSKDAAWSLPPDTERYFGEEAWRDPHVWRDETTGEHLMIVTAQAKTGPAAGLSVQRRTGVGCIALLKSSGDPDVWEPCDPIFKPGIYDAMECPDLFRIGDWWYLTFSEYRDLWSMHYRMAKSPMGPWICPADDSLDVRAFYAGKTTLAESRRFLIGWVSNKEGGKDAGSYQWGGALMVHELLQQADGTLGMRLPQELESAWDHTLPLTPTAALGSWNMEQQEQFVLQAEGEFTYLTLANMPEAYLVSTTVTWKLGTKMCGLLLHASDALNDGYMVYLEPERGLLKFEKWLRPWDYPSMECRVELREGCAKLKMLRSGTVIAIYVDDRKSMSGRIYDLQQGQLGLFVSEGNAAFNDVSLHDRL
jgi:beta-fructofuranosidase